MNQKKTRDFRVGVVAWFVINGLIWAAIGLLSNEMGPGAIILVPLFFLLGPVNLLAFIMLLVLPERRFIALGMLLAFVVNSIGILLFEPNRSLVFFQSLGMLPFFLLHRFGL